MTRAVRSVALDALFLDPGVSGGTETYVRELVPALVAAHPDVRFTLVTTRRAARALRREGWDDVLPLRDLPADDTDRVRRQLAEQVLLPALGWRERWDVVHNLANRAPVLLSQPSVLTLHDLIFFREEGLPRVSRVAMRTLTTRAVRGAAAVITFTEVGRHEIAETFGLTPSTVAVVPHGIGRRRRVEPTAAAQVRATYNLGSDRLVLCVAAKRPHKNQEALVRALPELPPDVRVVCAGHDEGYEGTLRQLAEAVGVADRVCLPGYVPDSDLEALWQFADCAAFPTLAEGFGMPVLEAMDRAVPVVCSDIPVLREVGGEAALYFNPHEPSDVARAIVQAMRDESLAEAGRKRARGYSWEAAAEATFEIYERVGVR